MSRLHGSFSYMTVQYSTEQTDIIWSRVISCYIFCMLVHVKYICILCIGFI